MRAIGSHENGGGGTRFNAINFFLVLKIILRANYLFSLQNKCSFMLIRPKTAVLGSDACRYPLKARREAAARVTNVSSGRVINDQCCIWVSFSDCDGSNWVDLLLPASSLNRGQFFFRHSVPSGKVTCHATIFSPIIDLLSVSVGARRETDLQ